VRGSVSTFRPFRKRRLGGIYVLLAAALFVGSAAVAAPSPQEDVASTSQDTAGRVMFGSWVKPRASDPVVTGNPGEDAVLNMESEIGARLTIDHVYLHFNDKWPLHRQVWDKKAGRIPLIAWEPEEPVVAWNQIAGGKVDGYINGRAKAARKFGSTIFLTFHHEPEDDTATYGTPHQFRLAWRHIVKRFRAVGATNVKFVFILTAETYRLGQASEWYPGSHFVDFVGADGYNWYGTDPTKAWRSADAIFAPFYSWSLSVGKPAMITETGTLEDPADPLRKAHWFDDVATWLPSVPNIRAFVYFSSDRMYPWWADSSEAALTSFSALRHSSVFR
jgi:Glycosyl hydrolase family 26